MQVENQGYTDYDLFLLRGFCKEELRKYLRPMRDFWAHAASYREREPGEYPLLEAEFVGSAGYRIEKRRVRRGSTRGLAAYPFVRTRSLRVTRSGKGSRFALRRALDEPLVIEEFHCVLDGDKRVAFLTDEAYLSTITERSVEACVVLDRGEAYALLAGSMPSGTRRKLMRAFGIEEGEWLDSDS